MRVRQFIDHVEKIGFMMFRGKEPELRKDFYGEKEVNVSSP